MATESAAFVTHVGGCHCKAVRFECQAPSELTAWKCNCTVCDMKKNIHFVVPESRFKVTEGEDQLSLYQFGSKTAKHLFCKVCGVTAFYRPRSNPDGVAVTLACVDKGTITHATIKTFDGENWEDSIKTSAIVEESKV